MRGRGALIVGGVIAVAAAVWVLLDGGDGIATVGPGTTGAPEARGGGSRGGVAASDLIGMGTNAGWIDSRGRYHKEARHDEKAVFAGLLRATKMKVMSSRRACASFTTAACRNTPTHSTQKPLESIWP